MFKNTMNTATNAATNNQRHHIVGAFFVRRRWLA